MKLDQLHPEIAESLALVKNVQARHFEIMYSVQHQCEHRVKSFVAPVAEPDGATTTAITRCMHCAMLFREPMSISNESLS